MKLPITPEFEREEKAFSLRRHCEDCVLYDVERPTRDRCAHGYPTEEHARATAGELVVFCKDFESA
jgi:hypothetical protein